MALKKYTLENQLTLHAAISDALTSWSMVSLLLPQLEHLIIRFGIYNLYLDLMNFNFDWTNIYVIMSRKIYQNF